MFSLAVSCSLSDRNAGISCCRVNPWNPKQVAISTWAGTVEVYDTTTGDCLQVQKRQSPQLAVEWVNKGVIASGGADGILFFNDLQVGSHSGPISCLSLVGQYLISGSFDRTVKVWDIISRTMVTEYTELSAKVLRIANDGKSQVFVACTERTIFRFDLTNVECSDTVEAPLPYQTRSIAANESFLAIGTYEGRVSVAHLSGNPSKQIAFKAHVSQEEVKICYPVNTMEFAKATNYLATGGSDGAISIWDVDSQRVVQALGDESGCPFDTSVASISFSNDGNLLAAAVSYSFEHGEQEHPPDRLVIYTS